MSIQITFSDREVIEVDISLDEWNRAYQKAIRGDAMLEIEEPNGRILSINPHSVQYLESSRDDIAPHQEALDLHDGARAPQAA